MLGRRHDRENCVGFGEQVAHPRLPYKFRVHEKLEPEHGLVRFFHYDTNLGDKLGLRTGAASRSIIRRDGTSRPEELEPNGIGFRGPWQGAAEAKHTHCEPLGARL